MRGLALLALVLGLISTVMPFGLEGRHNLAGESLAVSFGEFRRAAWQYVKEHPDQQGDIPLATLNLPITWSNVRNYRLVIRGDVACAYGSATLEESMDAHARLGHSAAVGYVLNGKLHPGDLALTVPVPNGVLLGIMEVTP